MATLEDRKRLKGSERVKYAQDRIKIICREHNIPEINPGESDGQKGPKTQLAIRRMKRSFGVREKNNNVSLDNGFIEHLYRPFDRRWYNAPGQWARGLAYRTELRRLHTRRLKAAEAAKKRNGVVGVALAAAAADSAGRRRSFYSQVGAWTTRYAVKGEPRGYRSDCSQWVTSCYYAAGRADPNGLGYAGGYTGTLVRHGKAISRSQLKPGDLIIYGAGVGHHVEMYVGPGNKTIGHGSTHVDAGTIDMLSGVKQYRTYA